MWVELCLQTPLRSSASTYWFAVIGGSLEWLVTLIRRLPLSGGTARFEDEGEVDKPCTFEEGVASELFPDELRFVGPARGFEVEAIIDFAFSKRYPSTGDGVGTALAEL